MNYTDVLSLHLHGEPATMKQVEGLNVLISTWWLHPDGQEHHEFEDDDCADVLNE